jgi:hypothetical protein
MRIAKALTAVGFAAGLAALFASRPHWPSAIRPR